MYKVTTWNINGIRSAKDLKSTLDGLDSDIICIQETKITREMLTEPLALVPGYSSYFDFSQRRSGYSGVATYCRQSATPVAAEPGVAGSRSAADTTGPVGCYGALPAELDPAERRELDAEGRCVVTLHQTSCQCAGEEQQQCHLAVINVYCPRADPDRPERLIYKLLFYRALRLRAAALRAAGHHVLLVGDLNCSHRPIDSCDPGDLKEFAASQSRRFLDSWLWEPGAADATPPSDADTRLVDTFRLLHPRAAEVYTCWNTQSNARQLNFGTRIDYILSDVAVAAAGRLERCDVLAEVQGSDHCPVRAAVRGHLLAAGRPPPACTRYYPEFAGRQVTLQEWCARLPPPEKRPPPPPQGQPKAVAVKRARAGQATLLGFVRRQPAPAPSRGGDSQGSGCTDSTAQAAVDRDAASDGVGDGEAEPKTEQTTGADRPESKTVSDESGTGRILSPSQTGTGQQKAAAAAAATFWSETLRALRPPPCRGHREPCVQRVVKKAGPNLGKMFWCCARGVGKPGDPLARCGHFEWLRRS